MSVIKYYQLPCPRLWYTTGQWVVKGIEIQSEGRPHKERTMWGMPRVNWRGSVPCNQKAKLRPTASLRTPTPCASCFLCRIYLMHITPSPTLTTMFARWISSWHSNVCCGEYSSEKKIFYEIIQPSCGSDKNKAMDFEQLKDSSLFVHLFWFSFWFLVLAQVLTSGSWDPTLCWALRSAQSLLGILSLPLPSPAHSLSLK